VPSPAVPEPESPARLSNGLQMTDLGERIRSERTRRGKSLESLAATSGVSRSMLSAVETGAKVPTVLLLDRIATALGTSISRLLDDETADRVIVRRYHEQDVAIDPAGWERRILSPVLPGVEFEFMRITIGPDIDAGAFSPHSPGSREYVAIEQGTVLLTIDGVPHTLNAGDSMYYAGDCVHAFANAGDTELVYYLAMDVTTGGPYRTPGDHHRPYPQPPIRHTVSSRGGDNHE